MSEPKKMADKSAKPSKIGESAEEGYSPDGTDDTTNKLEKRTYPLPDLKVLFSRSAGLCAYPGCLKECIKADIDVIDKVMVGAIGHIQGVAGARYNRDLSRKERDCYTNWILLCNLCHPVLDETDEKGFTKYPEETLRHWKSELEAFVRRRIQKEMPEITSNHLQSVTRYVLNAKELAGVDFTLTEPEKKIEKNKLSPRVTDLLQIGLGKAAEVNRFVEHSSVLEPDFAEQLKSGFVKKYKELWDKDFRGDALFEGLRVFACNASSDSKEQAAGLAVLAYLFERCEVFEK